MRPLDYLLEIRTKRGFRDIHGEFTTPAALRKHLRRFEGRIVGARVTRYEIEFWERSEATDALVAELTSIWNYEIEKTLGGRE